MHSLHSGFFSIPSRVNYSGPVYMEAKLMKSEERGWGGVCVCVGGGGLLRRWVRFTHCVQNLARSLALPLLGSRTSH